MKSSLRPTSPQDAKRLQEFLALAFEVDASAAFLQPAMLAWKYWEPREDWTEPRSFVLEREGEIIAHAGVWPFGYQSGAENVRGIQMIDWAAAKDSPGAGLTLVQKLGAMFDFIYSIGGSDATQKVLPAFGFTQYTQQWKGVRPLRPLQHALSHQRRDWKLPVRLLRNALWTVRSSPKPSNGWSALPCKPAAIASSCPRSEGGLTSSPRTPAFFRYLEQCPLAQVRLFCMMQDGAPRGHFALSLVRGQARIAGVWLLAPTPEGWQQAYALACQAAQQWPGAYELVTSGSQSGPHREAAIRAGFRTAESAKVFLLDRKKKLSLSPEFQFQFADDDQAFLDSGSTDFWC